MERLNNILASYVADEGDNETKGKIHGVAFVVVDKNGPIYQGSAGRLPSSIRESPKFTVDTQVWVASLTKIVTAVCLMQLVEKRLLSLDDDVRMLVPELGMMGVLTGFFGPHARIEQNPNPITVRSLLTHTAGLGYDLDANLVKWSNSVGRHVNNLSFTWDGWNTPLLHASQEGWCYGSGVDWATKVLMFKTGQDFGKYVEEHICKPLGIENTAFRPATFEAGFTANRDAAGNLISIPLPVPLVPPTNSGGCGLYTTASDFTKILTALLRDGNDAEHDGPRLLTKHAVVEMFRPQLTPLQRNFLQAGMRRYTELIPWKGPSYPVERLDHGITGVINLDDLPGKRRNGSMSWLGMNNSHWWIDPRSGIAASLIVNLMNMPDTVVENLYNEIEHAVYGELLPSIRREDGSYEP
ncbi:beta-lactamase/transpeptidase-like protein [Coniochaeta ligniaria NRRL 30616]|uniref:Beta-lactamase/transpeptidase-like protein n=1 Tax=Coniochaeta ligniaria NRRL 30616 TaxID=1408157 RepID=A0A1J7ICZ3_9PEZI|nr:beta-lactamase/transpeptidase-like protein [Coniochaeta ligniaria NRRL 30616]